MKECKGKSCKTRCGQPLSQTVQYNYYIVAYLVFLVFSSVTTSYIFSWLMPQNFYDILYCVVSENVFVNLDDSVVDLDRIEGKMLVDHGKGGKYSENLIKF